MSLGVDTRRQEALESCPTLIDDAERRVARSRQLRGSLDELLQERIQRELGTKRDSGVDQHA